LAASGKAQGSKKGKNINLGGTLGNGNTRAVKMVTKKENKNWETRLELGSSQITRTVREGGRLSGESGDNRSAFVKKVYCGDPKASERSL